MSIGIKVETPDSVASQLASKGVFASPTVFDHVEPSTPEEVIQIERMRFARALASIIVTSQHNREYLVTLCDVIARLANENKPFKERLKRKLDSGRKVRWSDKDNYWLLAFYWIYKDRQKPGETRKDMLAKLLKEPLCAGLNSINSLENQISKALSDIGFDARDLPPESRAVALREQATPSKLVRRTRTKAPSANGGNALANQLNAAWRKKST